MSCDGGSRRRYRYCVNGVVGEFGCEDGDTSEVEDCNVNTVGSVSLFILVPSK